MRLFIALFPAAEALRRWDEFKKPPDLPIRWVPTPSLHMTLKFLGEVPLDVEGKIHETLSQLASAAASFTIRLKGGGVFPPKGAPSIFWVGVEGDIAALSSLANGVIAEMKNLGFPIENRPFHPHMTVARPEDRNRRLSGAQGRQFVEWIAPFESELFSVTRICLVQSELRSTGSEYSVRREYIF